MNIIRELASLLNDDAVKTYDLNTEEGYNEYMNTINELKEDKEAQSLFNALDIDIDNILDTLAEIGSEIHTNKKENKKEIKKEEKKTSKQIERKEVDHTIKFVEDDDPKFKRPSELLSIDQKLQLHKIVQEYVDTMIKPFNKGLLSSNQINDAYAGLYEFAAWIMNR